jgi:hypothetical protein
MITIAEEASFNGTHACLIRDRRLSEWPCKSMKYKGEN